MKSMLKIALILTIGVTCSFAGSWEWSDAVVNGYAIATDEGEAGINLPGFKNAYSVAVDPLGKVWFGSYYERRLADATLPELERYPDLFYVITERDTGTGAFLDTAKIWGSPVFVWDPADGSIDTIRFMEFADGSVDTIVYGKTHRGMARSYDGNMIVATSVAVYKVNYQTYEAMVKWTAPEGATPLQSLATDDNGYVYTQSLWGGDLFVLDPDDLSLYTTVTDAAPFTRGGGVNDDGTEVFVGLTGGGAQRYTSDWGPDGTYVLEDTVGSEILVNGMSQWDPAGYLWNIGCDSDLRMWSFDASADYIAADTTSFSFPGAGDTTIYGYAAPQFVRCVRDAGFNVAGDKFYLADMYGYTIKEYEYVEASVDREKNQPIAFKLSQNYPNPFNPTTTIPFDITTNDVVKLTVFDITGRQVATLINKELPVGHYSPTFDGSGFASGPYFYELVVGDQKQVQKMLLIK